MFYFTSRFFLVQEQYLHHMPKVADMVKNIVVTILTFISFFLLPRFLFPPPPHDIPGKEECSQKCLLWPSGLLLLCCPELQKWERGSPSLIQEEEKKENNSATNSLGSISFSVNTQWSVERMDGTGFWCITFDY